jgi:DNA-binding MarR family transcriptional regulator
MNKKYNTDIEYFLRRMSLKQLDVLRYLIKNGPATVTDILEDIETNPGDWAGFLKG